MRYAFGFLCMSAGIVLCQTTTPRQPHFEVASVKLWDGSRPVIRGPGVYATVSITDTNVTIHGAPLGQLIQVAYDVKPFQIVGPEWLTTDKFEVLATIPAGFGKNDVPAMMRALLAERFVLVAHRATSIQPAYALVVGKGGPKLLPAVKVADEEPVNKVKLTGEGVLGTVRSKSPFGPFSLSMSDGVLHNEFMQMTVANLAQYLTPLQGLPVVDRTGLKGEYDIKLDLSSSDVGANAGIAQPDISSSPAGASFFNAVEKLGLKLEQTKAPLDQIIVDSINKTPTAN